MAKNTETATRGDVATVGAALLRMQAHTLAVQGELLLEMSETLRGQADRVEHGGELPDLHVVEEEGDPDEGLVLPRIARGASGWGAVDTHGIPHADVEKFLGEFHSRWLHDVAFGAVFNRTAAGERPSFELAQKVVAELAALEPS